MVDKADKADKTKPSEKEAIEGVTEGPEMDKSTESEGDDRVDQLTALVDRCVADGMQAHIIAQKAGTLNASFAEPLPETDMVDLAAYARDKLDQIRIHMSV